MDAHRFDTLTRSLTGSSYRRILLRAIVGAPLRPGPGSAS